MTNPPHSKSSFARVSQSSQINVIAVGMHTTHSPDLGEYNLLILPYLKCLDSRRFADSIQIGGAGYGYFEGIDKPFSFIISDCICFVRRSRCLLLSGKMSLHTVAIERKKNTPRVNPKKCGFDFQKRLS